MKKLILTVVAVALAMILVTDASAGIFRRRWRPARVYAPPAAAATVHHQVHGRGTGEHAYENVIDKPLDRGF